MQTIRRVLVVIFGVVLLTAGAVIGVENDTPVVFQLFGSRLGELPLGMWVLIAFALGALLALLATQVSVSVLRRRVRSLNRQVVLARQQHTEAHS